MYKTRIPEITAEIPARVNRLTRTAAELVAEGARVRVPVDTGRLRDAIHVSWNDQLGGYSVLAGDNQAFYGHIVEHGGVNTGPRPFLVPAATEVRSKIEALGIEALANL